MSKGSILAAVCLWNALALAQNAQPHLDPDRAPAKTSPTVTFTLDFPAYKPPFYSISIESGGRAEYKSTPEPNNVGDPYVIKFVVSESTRTRLFEAARQLKNFDGQWDYTKNRVAFTGTKTLTFKNSEQEHATTYNWSENPTIQELTALFQNIAEAIELGRQLEDKYRYDKLGVDAILKILEQDAKDKRVAELQAIQPILFRVAKDPSLMNISRRRAEFLLTQVPKDAAVVSNGGRP